MLSVWEILVPVIRGDSILPPSVHCVWDEAVQKIAGGLTIFSPVHGKWLSPKQEIIKERMIPVRIACTEKQINQIADMTAQHYHQESVMFYKVSDTVVIKNYGRNNDTSKKD